MRTEVKDVAVEVITKPAVGGFLAWLSSIDWAGVLALVLLVVQIAYTLRKWWREETHTGRKMRGWAARRGLTSPGELGE